MRRWGIVGAAAAALALSVVPAHAATATLEGVPGYQHVVTIVLENENYAATWSTPGANGKPTYLQSLRSSGAFASEYFGVGHVSADNYIAMTSGQLPTPPFDGDCIASWQACELTEKVLPAGNIADQVEAQHKTWKAYMDGMQTDCQHPGATTVPDPYQTGYATRHNPFVYYPSIVENTKRCNAHVVPFTQFAADFSSKATTPNYVFITPDTCHDGHDAPCSGTEAGQPGGLASANAWLQKEVPLILNSPAFRLQRSLLLITFDENGISDVQGCCGALAGGGPTSSDLALGGRIGLLAIGSHVHPGTVVGTPYDHWSYLRTVEDALAISTHLNVAGLPITHPMTGLFG